LNTQRRKARVVGIVARLWGWMVHSMNPTRGKRFVSPPKPLDQLWRPCSFLVSGYQGSFHRGKVARV